MRRLHTYAFYGYELFVKRIIVNLLLVFELVVSIIAINLLVSSVAEAYADVNIIRRADENALFVMPSREVIGASDGSSIDFSFLKGGYREGKGYQVFVNTPFGNQKITLYNTDLLSAVDIPLTRGAWDGEILEENGKIFYPIVVSDTGTLRLGDRFEGAYDTYRINFYVAGILNTGGRYINLQASSSVLNTNQVIGKTEGELQFFACSDKFPLDTFTLKWEALNRIVICEETEGQEYEENITLLRNIGYVFTCDEIIENSIDNIRLSTRLYIPLAVGVLLVSSIGLMCFSLLNIYKNKKFYKILSVCGGTKKDCIIISLVSFLLILALSIGVICIAYNLAVIAGLWRSMSIELSYINTLVTMGIYAFVVIFGYIFPLLLIKQKRLIL